MSKNVMVDPEALNQAASLYQKAAYLLDGDDGKACSVDSVVSSINTVIKIIHDEWEGKACDEFARRLTDELKHALELATILRGMQVCCKKVAELYKFADNVLYADPITRANAYTGAQIVTHETGSK